MMLLLVILAILLLVPIKVEITGEVNNLELRGRLRVVFLHCLPLNIGIYNLKDRPLEFKLWVLGKATDAAKLAERIQARRKKNESKERRAKQDKAVLKTILNLRRYVRRLEIVGKIGIKERADVTAMLVGFLNGTVFPGAVLLGIKKVKVYFIPEYNLNTADIDWECIISMNAANIIHEGIRYFLQRRK